MAWNKWAPVPSLLSSCRPLGHARQPALREQVPGARPELSASRVWPLLSEFLVTSVDWWCCTRSPKSVPLVFG